jgi:hypothetical protein
VRHAERERRRWTRFPQILDIHLWALPPVSSRTPKKNGDVVGRIQNISKTGICIVTEQPLEKSAVVRCELTLFDVPVVVPTILEVRWTRKQKVQQARYLSGLEYLI